MPSPFFPDKEGGFAIDTKGAKDLIRLACGKPPSPEGKVAERSEVG